MEETTINGVLDEIKEDLSQYAKTKANLIKLDAYEKAGKITAMSISGIIMLALVFFMLMFILIAGAIYIGDVTNNFSLGFLVMGGILLFVTLVFALFFKKHVEYLIMNTVIGILMEKEAHEN